MMQKSVYSKLVINDAATASAITRLRKIRPPEGLVQVLKVTEKQFATMTFITGEEEEKTECDTTEEFIVI
jgi:CRISPR-associated protein Cas2